MSDNIKLVIEIEESKTLLRASEFDDYDQLCEELVTLLSEMMYAPPSMITVSVEKEEKRSEPISKGWEDYRTRKTLERE